MFATFLSWLNDRTCPVFVVATSNNFTILPPELIRKGRVDELFWIDLPDSSERKDIWNVIIKRYGRKPKDFDIPNLVKKSDKFTGSEIEEVFKSAMFYAFDKGKEVDDDHVVSQLADITPQAITNASQLDKMRAEAKGKLRVAKELTQYEKESRSIEASFDSALKA